jgi:hypothetical protein
MAQVVTLEGWTDVAIVLHNVGGVPGGVYVYSIILLGSYYVINLLLVVTWQASMSQQAKKPGAVATATHLVLDAPTRPPSSSSASSSASASAHKIGVHRCASRHVARTRPLRVHAASDTPHASPTSRAKWVHTFLGHDPRRQICNFFKPGDHRGPLGYLQDKRLKPDPNHTSSFFSVWRPTSMDAIRMMVEGRATGKPLTIKGKSAQKGEQRTAHTVHAPPHRMQCTLH